MIPTKCLSRIVNPRTDGGGLVHLSTDGGLPPPTEILKMKQARDER